MIAASLSRYTLDADTKASISPLPPFPSSLLSLSPLLLFHPVFLASHYKVCHFLTLHSQCSLSSARSIQFTLPAHIRTHIHTHTHVDTILAHLQVTYVLTPSALRVSWEGLLLAGSTFRHIFTATLHSDSEVGQIRCAYIQFTHDAYAQKHTQTHTHTHTHTHAHTHAHTCTNPARW
jgi:hypothetical protein